MELALIQKHGGDIEDWKNNNYARKIVRAAYTKIGKRKYILQLQKEISEYATQKVGECLAEAVSDYLANGEKAAKLSKAIWEILKEELN